MAKYLVSGYVGFDNFGDEAIVSVLSKYLKEIGAEKITWISSDCEKTANTYGVNSVGMLKLWKALKECDVLISGGGSLLQDITSLKSLLYYLAIIVFALLLRKKVIIFAQGITPFRTKIGEFLTRFVLKRCDCISVRDEFSQQLLEKWGIKSELVFDPVFALDIPYKNKQGVGVQLRGFENLTEEFLEQLAECIYKYFENTTIKLISMQNAVDVPVLKKFQQMLAKHNVMSNIIETNKLSDGINILSGVEYLIAMRFHACLVGAKSGSKVLGINYDKKVENLANLIGFPSLNIKEECQSKVEELLNLQTDKYNLPQFMFPNLSE